MEHEITLTTPTYGDAARLVNEGYRLKEVIRLICFPKRLTSKASVCSKNKGGRTAALY